MTWPLASANGAGALADLGLSGLGAAAKLGGQVRESAVRVHCADEVLASGCAVGAKDDAAISFDHFLVLRFFALSFNASLDGFFFVGLLGFRIDFFIPRIVGFLSSVDVG